MEKLKPDLTLEARERLDLSQDGLGLSSTQLNLLSLSPMLRQNKLDHLTMVTKTIQHCLSKRGANLRHLCRKTIVLSCHGCLIKTGVEKTNILK